MPLIPGELLARAFLTKSLISPSFKGESSNFSSCGCGRLSLLRRLNGVSVSESVYFFWRCASKSSFDILRTPFFSPSNNFLVNLNGFFSKLRLAFFPYFFPVTSVKLFSLSYNQKSLMKPCAFDSKPSSSSWYTFIHSVILSSPSFAYI